jgi:hypothetical protein
MKAVGAQWTRPVAKAGGISYTLAGRRLLQGMHSYDASTGPRAMARGDTR